MINLLYFWGEIRIENILAELLTSDKPPNAIYPERCKSKDGKVSDAKKSNGKVDLLHDNSEKEQVLI